MAGLHSDRLRRRSESLRKIIRIVAAGPVQPFVDEIRASEARGLFAIWEASRGSVDGSPKAEPVRNRRPASDQWMPVCTANSSACRTEAVDMMGSVDPIMLAVAYHGWRSGGGDE
jgi:hypothetical protein